MNFVYDTNTYRVGETYTDNLGETEISAVYPVPTNSDSNHKPNWTNNVNITAANFEESFYGFEPTSTAYWFYIDKSLAKLTNGQNLNTSKVTDMHDMFYYAGYNATTWSIGDIGGWNTSSVTNMSSMFSSAGYKAPYSLDLSGWDISKIASASKHKEFNYLVESKITPPVWQN